jgi:hypothetical protein
MSSYGGANIVTDGLVLMLDAANVRSYSASSTTWFDLSGNRYASSLTNGPAYNSENGGSIMFDGTNDYAKTNTTLNLSNTDKISVEVWLKFTATSLQVIAEHSTNFNANNAFLMDINEIGGTGSFQFGDKGPQGYNISYTKTGFNDGKWHCFTSTSDRTQSATQQIKIYADSVLDTTLSDAYRADITSSYSNYDLYLATRAGTSFFYSGSISSIKIYNRILTPEEVLQNYNATKSRYNL